MGERSNADPAHALIEADRRPVLLQYFENHLGWFAAPTVPDAAAIMTVTSDGAPHHWLLTDDSWGGLGEDGRVVQGGRRRIWDEIEAAWNEWLRLGEPERDRFSVAVGADGAHLRLDGPEQRGWPM
ncbi:hypothetical protein [Streptomonospora sediminis]